MHIANIIRQNRRAKDMTQENLAEILGVSVSAVSLWESGKTMPDIALLPALCSVLGVSADKLLGIDLDRKDEEIAEILEEANKVGSRGYQEESVPILEEGLKRYPDSWVLIHTLMSQYALWYHADHDYPDRREKAIELGERILAGCTEASTRSSAIQTLCYLYRETDPNRVEKLLENTETIFTSREVIAATALQGDKQIDAQQNLITQTLDLMTQEMWDNRKNDADKPRFTYEEWITVLEKIITIYHTVFEDEDFGFYHTRLQDFEMPLAIWYAQKQDAGNTLDHLRKAAHHAIEFVKYVDLPEFTHTSLVLRGQKAGGFSTNGSGNAAQTLLDSLNDIRYNFLRDTDAFREILDQLTPWAGEWKKLS